MIVSNAALLNKGISAKNAGSLAITYAPCPTGDGTDRDIGTRWNIFSSVLGCGVRVLQGWSEGIGMGSNKDDFEDKLFLLTYYSHWSSVHPARPINFWYSRSLEGNLEAPIMVSRSRFQFLAAPMSYVLSSHDTWLDRFAAYVSKHKLGTFSKTHSFVNTGYKNNKDAVALWTWNRACPPIQAYEGKLGSLPLDVYPE